MCKITIEKFIQYLIKLGFREREDWENDDLIVYRKVFEGHNIDMVFPSSEEYLDYDKKIKECINTLAKICKKPKNEILKEVNGIGVNDVRVGPIAIVGGGDNV